MKIRMLTFAAMLALLAGCSRTTLLTLEIDILPLLGDVASGIFPATTGSVDLPDADGLESVQLGVPIELFTGLERVALVGEGTFMLTGTEPVTIVFSLFIAEGPSAFAATDPIVLSLALQPGVATDLPVGFVLSSEQSQALFARLVDGDFRLGIRLAASGTGTVDYQLGQFDVSVSVQAGTLLPF